MDKFGIIHHFSYNTKSKANIAEGAIKIIKSKIGKLLTFSEKNNWLQFFNNVIDSLNKRPLKSLGGRSPSEINYSNQNEIFKLRFGSLLNWKGPKKKPKFLKNDLVRVQLKNWTISQSLMKFNILQKFIK